MKEKRKTLVISITIVVLIIFTVAGATYAYWTWITSKNEQTDLILSVDQTSQKGKLNARINGAVQNVSKLIPVSSCTNENYVIKKPIILTYTNTTENNAIVKGTLTVSNFVSPNGKPNENALKYIKYAVTKNADNCTTDIIDGMSGSFNTTNGNLFSNITLKDNILEKNTIEMNETYYLWVWLDKNYSYQNIGNNETTDPMQDISFTLSWTGEISNET